MSTTASRKNVEDIYRLSPVQQGMLFHTLMAPGTGVYCEQFAFGYGEGFDPDVFEAAWQRLMARHPMLRTAYLWEGLEDPVQVVYRRVELAVERHDWRELAPEEREERHREYLAEDRRRGFDLDRPPLVRLAVIRFEDEVHRVVLTYHHLLLDGWSIGLLLQELWEISRGMVLGVDPSLPERRPFREYIRWLRRQDLSEAREYWRRRLDGFREPTPLAVDRPAAGDEDRGYELVSRRVPAAATARLKAFAQRNRLTLNTLVQGAYALLLSRYAGRDDVAFGVTLSGRPPSLPGVEAMVGCFINTLPFRVRVDPERRVLPWLEAIQSEQVELRRFEHTPLVEVRAVAQVDRDRELFESIFVFESFTAESALEMSRGSVFQRTNYPLTVVAAPDDRLILRAGFELARFDAPDVERLLEHLETVLLALVGRPQRRLRDVALIGPAERRKALTEWNLPEADFRGGPAVHERFAEHAARRQDAVALVFGDRTVTYGALASAAKRLARRLAAEGVGPESRVALCLERSVEMVTGVLGVLAAGGAYVPLDPAAPEERLRFIVEDSGASVVVTTGALAGSLPEGPRRLLVDGAGSPPAQRPEAPPVDHPAEPDGLAYVIYTSGSTGRPKGSLVRHGSVARLFDATADWFSFGPEDAWTLFHSYAFDFSVWEIWGALAYGGRLVGVPYWVSRSPDAFLDLLARERVTVLSQTPSAFKQLVAADAAAGGPPSPAGEPALSTVVFGGEALEPSSLAPWFERHGDRWPRLVNMYGITETTVHVTYRPVTAADLEGRAGSPVGVPIPDLQVHLLDPWANLVPVGVPGEIHVGGEGLARGYLDRPGLTAERFVPDPFAAEAGVPGAPGRRLYRAGDLARRLPDGGLDFLGRIDQQVKVRGFRIELGEIEAVLSGHEAVGQVAVVPREDAPGDLRLVAYVVPAGEAALHLDELRAHTARYLPDYMVPAAFVELAELPLTVNGKLDRSALPAPEAGERLGAEADQEPPATPTEELLAAVWGEILGVEAVGRGDDFFDLGGHSLLATRVASRLREVLGVEVPLRSLFEETTLRRTAALVDRLRRAGAPRDEAPIRRVDREGGVPLSFAQERLWFLDRMEPASSAYNVPGAVRLRGGLDITALARSVAGVVARHDALRTVFATRDGRPVQVVLPPERTRGWAALPVVDLSALPEGVREPVLGALARRQASLPFDLTRGPLLRATLVRLAPSEHAVLMAIHHVVSDAWSLGVFVRELAAGYAAAVSGRPSPLPELPVQYPDFAVWQREWLQGEVLVAQLDFWRGRLAGAPPVLALPTDRPRPAVQSYRGDVLTTRLPAGLTGRLQELGRRRGATPYMVLMAAFKALLARYSGQADLIVGSTIANRTREEVQGLIGFFVNTLALRTDLSDDPGFAALVDRVRRENLDAYDHQDLPFEKLVEEVQPQRDLSRSPLFQVVMQLQNAPDGALELPGLTLEPVVADSRTAKFDLILNLSAPGRSGGGIQAVWRYRTDLFDATTVRRMAGHLQVLLEAAVDAPDRPVSTLSLVTAAERQALLVEPAGEPEPGEAGAFEPVHRRFASRAAERPETPAATCGSETLSYGELERRANRLAHALRGAGVGPEVPVALCLDRSLDLVTAVLGVLKAGGAYVPLDPSYPAERLAFVLADCRAPVVLTRRDLVGSLPPAPDGTQVFTLDRGEPWMDGADPGAPAAPAGPGQAAYVIYTSGSTGRPKGVTVTHGDVARLLTATDPWFGFGPDDVWTLFHSYAFDFSVWELWGALAFGGRLVVVPYELSRSPEAFHDLLLDEGVTVLNQTPSAFRQLVRADAGRPPLEALRTVVFGGEALELAALGPWIARYGDRRPRLVNMYGITETTVHVTYRPVAEADLAAGRGSVIGRPIPDLRVHLLDRRMAPVPVGPPGEIHVAGRGLARGYLARPGLTAERFVPDPFAGLPGRSAGDRLYKSGDLARHLPETDLEYLGRIDHQVKVRGFRIELGEIETALAGHPEVAEAVVVARESAADTGPRLVAYAVPAGGARPGISDLRSHLAASLPEYMVPAAVVLLEAIPLTANGKVDRRALPEPEAERPDLGQEMVAPRDRLEEVLAGLWREELGLDAVGVHDDFFDLGGNSLVGAVLINRLQELLGEIVHVVVIFDAPTVAEMAEHLRRQHPAAVARLLGEGETAEESAEAEAPPVDEAMASTVRELLGSMPRFTVGPVEPGPPNPPAVFLLSAPRSGSTLLRVMLAGHPGLFAPPELELLSFHTLADRRAVFQGRDAFWLEGAIRAVMEIEGVSADEARERIGAWEDEALPTARFYRWLQERLGDRLLVDKTPSYALRPDVLARAETEFRGARYLHLVRHPYGMIRSFEEAKLDQIFFPAEHPFTRRQLAELIWLVSERNVRAFLAGVDPERWHRVRFEDLTREPEGTLREVCDFLGLAYDPAMAEPYRQTSGRMTDGIHAQSRMLGDVKFHRHSQVEARVAEHWREEYRRDFLGAVTWEAAAPLGYEPLERRLAAIEPSGWRPGEPLPVSFAQERLWFLDQLDPGTHTYNVPVAVRLAGRLEPAALGRAVTDVVRRQASLRTTFTTVEGRPAQVVVAAGPWPLPVVDLSALPEPLRGRTAQKLATDDARRPFDLAAGPLFRATLLRLRLGGGRDEHAALLAMHHVVSDGWSMGVLVRELASAYSARAAGTVPELPELPVQYPDFAAWQRSTVSDEALEEQLRWWRERLAGVPVLQLPTDRPRPGVQTFRGATRPFRHPRELADGLGRVARRGGATRYATMLAAFQAFLGRWAGQDDLAVGSPFANRGRAEIEELIGFFVNTLVLRAELAGEPSFLELLERTRGVVRGAFAHQDVPFERVVQEVQPQRSLSVPPLFQAMLTLQDRPALEAVRLEGLTLQPLESPTAISKFDLTLTVVESGGDLAGQWVWNTDLFDAATVERLGRSFETFLGGVARDPERRVAEIPLLTPEERREVLEEWNRPAVDYPEAGAVGEMVARQAAATPDAVAIAAEGHLVSYGELIRASGRLARRLRASGVGAETVVAVAAERSPEMIVAFLGILEAGGAYLPLDPELPTERLAFMLADAGASHLLTRDDLLAGTLDGVLAAVADTTGRRPRLLSLDGSERASEGGAPPAGPSIPCSSESAAYVLYTSGSTGRPKGVVVQHAALANRLQYARAADLSPLDAFLQKTTASFDVSVGEIFGPLVAGGRTVLPRPGGEKDTAYLVDLIARERVTWTSFPPTLLFGLLEEEGFRRLDSLRVVITGGETVPPELPPRFYEVLDAELRNRYGPTETTVSVTSWSCSREREGRALPIGLPTAKARIHVLDPRLAPVPPGVVGEIVVGGPGVARGYLGRPARTARSFVPDPFSGVEGARLYRTGDLARFRGDGAVEFVGRADRQVKIRGFRVELGEIEAVLASHPEVREAVVVDRGEGSAKTLAAYLVPEEGAAADRWDLQARVEAELPAHMVPSHFTVLPELPVTPTGKVDRAALPEPEAPSEGPVEPPVGPVEEVVASIWTDLLERPPAGRFESFFDAGGHSLLATRVVSRLRDAFGVEVPLRHLFEEPTVAGLARRVERLSAEAAGSGPAPPLVPVPRPAEGPAELPASFGQVRLWFLERLIPGTATFHMVTRLRLAGELDVAALARTLAALTRRHETLRTAFAEVDGAPVQRVEPAVPVPLGVVDLAGLSETLRPGAVARIARSHAVRPFDLRRAPLVRMALVRLDAREHQLLLTLHHAMADGWSIGVLVREVAALYRAFAAGEPSRLAPLPVQYGDFAAWQRDYLSGEELERQLGYWRDRLAGAPSALQLPTDRPRPPVQAFRGAYEPFRLPEPVAGDLRRHAAEAGGTLFMALLAGLSALFGRLSGQGDVVVGTPIAGRTRIETEGLIGLFLNNLTLRVDLGDDPSFRELASRVRATTLGAYAHQDVPFEKVVEALTPVRDLSHAPLFQHALVLQNAPAAALDLPGLVLERLEADTGTTRFDLSLVATETGDGLAGRMFYNRDLYDPETVRRMLGWLETLVRSALEAPERQVSELSLLTAAEREELQSWNRTEADYPGAPRLHDLIVDRAGRTPDAVAVSAGTRSLTYAGLERRSAALAARLRGHGVGPDALVGVCAERSVELLVALVAVLRSGGAYVPLDPSYPEDRLAYMVESSGARVLLVQEATAGKLPPSRARVLTLEAEPVPAAHAEPVLDLPGDDGALAYVIYTSGSTGRPKGAGNAHRGIVNRLRWMQETYGLDGSDSVLQKTPFSFDVSVWELFWPLVAGARLVMAEPGGHRDPGYLAATIARERVTTIHFVPSMLQVFLDAPGVEACRPLRRVIASGEALPLDLVERHYRRLDAPLHNLYGPTEAAVDVTWWPTRPGDARGLVPIGRPVANTRIHLVDPRMEEVPAGVAGELLIGGVQVARGYHGRPALTAERFVPDPWAAAFGAAGTRLYRTGDLARRLRDGAVDFLGRIDHQVKVRGFRIELGEVETALAAHPEVREAVVVARGEDTDRRLVAYVVAAGDVGPDPERLRRWVAERLPDAMVPATVMVLDEMPLSPNGKVDRRRLPEPDAAAGPGDASFVAPRTPTEELVAAMWAERLGRERVSATADFFAAGGNSLAAAVFVNRLQERLGEIVHVVSLFDRPTVEGFAAYLESEYPEATARLVGGEVAARSSGPHAGPGVTDADVSVLRRLVPPRPPSADEEEAARRGDRNPPAVFVLAPPRSGTTLLRVMLAGHPRLFAPPELELLPYRTLGERRDAFPGRDAFRLEGLIRAVMEARGCGVEEARTTVAELEARDAGVAEAYRLLQEWIGDRLLVDKTPTYAWSPDTLAAAEALFREPRYVHLVRHPRAVARSFEEARLEQIFFRQEHPFTRRQLGELLWTVSHETVETFLRGVPRARRLRVDFEDLVSRPEQELRRIASFLGLEYHPDMARPYDGSSRRMTDGLHEESRMIGDVKFHRHRGIDAAAAGRWRSRPEDVPLGEPTRRVAQRLGLALEAEPGASAPSSRRTIPAGVVGLRGGGDEPPLFLVHPVAGDVYFYRDLVRALPGDRPVFGFQAPGLDGVEEPLGTVEGLAARHVASLLELRPEGPYLLAGSSLGGTVAYEMARRLRAAGREVVFLGMVDTPGTTQLPAPFRGAQAEAMVLSYLAGSVDAEAMRALEARAPEERPGPMRDFLARAGRLPEGLDERGLALLVGVIRSNQAAMIAYRPEPYDGAVAFFRAADGGERYDEPREEPWRPLVRGELTVRVVPGNHLSMNLPPHARHLARALDEEIDRALARGERVAAALAASD